MKEKQKGITLIALVITIIVLLILAGVSIAMLTGQNGILSQAQNANVENRAGSVDDEVKLWKSEWKIYSFNGGEEPLSEENFLNKLKNDNLVEDSEINTVNKTIEIGSRIINFSLDMESEKNFNLGEYVNYIYDSSDNYVYQEEDKKISFNFPQTEGLQWRILKINDDTLDLVATTTTQDALGLMSKYEYSVDEIIEEYKVLPQTLNAICEKHYSNKELGITARSILLEDYTQECKEILENINNKFFFATEVDNKVGSGYALWSKSQGEEPYQAIICYDNLYNNQTSGSTSYIYILPVVSIPKSLIGEKVNNIWQMQ